MNMSQPSFAGRIKQLFKDILRLRPRHLRLGPKMLFKLFLYRFRKESQPGSEVVSESPNELSWSNRKITITVGITVFNQEAFELNRAILSVLNQHRLPNQIILFDDGSTSPETKKTLQEIANMSENINLVVSSNLGVVQARNKIIELAKTTHIVFLDPDDELDLAYLYTAERLFLKFRKVEIVYPDVMIVEGLKEERWVTGPFNSIILSKVNTIPMSSICSLSLLQDLQGFSIEFENGFEDWDLWLRASLIGVEALHLNEIGYRYSKKLLSRSSEAEIQKARLFRIIESRQFGTIRMNSESAWESTQIFLLAPWYIEGGGVDNLLSRFINHFKDANIALVTTENMPLSYKSAISEELKSKIPVIERRHFSSDENFIYNLKKLATKDAIAINFSSPWAFENSKLIGSFITEHFAFAFNEIGLNRIRNCKGPLTEAWPAYTALAKNLIQKKKNQFQIEIIHIGIEKRVVTPLKKEKPVPLTIGWLGRLSPEKDPFLYLELADQFNESGLVFKMAGDGPLREKVEARISKIKNVKFEGFVENSEDFLKSLDILILTSEIEGIPLAAMEALQLGVFVVAPKIGGLSDLIRNDKDGLLYRRSKMHAAESIRKAVELVSQGRVSPSLDSNFEEKSMFDRIESRIEYHAKKSNLESY